MNCIVKEAMVSTRSDQSVFLFSLPSLSLPHPCASHVLVGTENYLIYLLQGGFSLDLPAGSPSVCCIFCLGHVRFPERRYLEQKNALMIVSPVNIQEKWMLERATGPSEPIINLPHKTKIKPSLLS